MKLNGSATLDAPVQRVWDALRDPEVLVRTIPGCERLETVGQDAYKMTVSAGVASIKGTYVGEVALTEPEPPHFVVLKARGQGAPGMIDATVRVRLSAVGEDGTRIDYEADATVGGMIGGVGQRMLTTVAKKTAGEFFADVNRLLVAPAPGIPVVGLEPAITGPGNGQAVAGSGALAAGEVTGGVPVAAAARGPGGPAAPGVFTAPARPSAQAEPRVLVGAFAVGGAVALTGVLVGWMLGRRGRGASGGAIARLGRR